MGLSNGTPVHVVDRLDEFLVAASVDLAFLKLTRRTPRPWRRPAGRRSGPSSWAASRRPPTRSAFADLVGKAWSTSTGRPRPRSAAARRRSTCRRLATGPSESADPSPTPSSSCSTGSWNPSHPARLASSTSAAMGWGAATADDPPSRPSSCRPRPRRRRTPLPDRRPRPLARWPAALPRADRIETDQGPRPPGRARRGRSGSGRRRGRAAPGPTRRLGPRRRRSSCRGGHPPPPHLVPSRYVHVDEWPLTPSGKVDHLALPSLLHEASAGRGRHEYPPRRSRIAAIWELTLGIDGIGLDDDFSRWAATRSWRSTWSRAPTGRPGPQRPHALFTHPTIRELVPQLDRVAEAEHGAAPGPVPLTPIQAWFFGLGLAGPDHWNQSVR